MKNSEKFQYKNPGDFNMYGFSSHLEKYRYLVKEPNIYFHEIQRRKLVLEVLEESNKSKSK